MKQLLDRIRAFNGERDWDQYHSPKNLAMGLMIEAAELAEQFLWDTTEESLRPPPEKRTAIEEEIGDVLIYLLNLADKLEIDVLDAARKKLETNRQKYPVKKVRGKKGKWTEYL